MLLRKILFGSVICRGDTSSSPVVVTHRLCILNLIDGDTVEFYLCVFIKM